MSGMLKTQRWMNLSFEICQLKTLIMALVFLQIFTVILFRKKNENLVRKILKGN